MSTNSTIAYECPETRMISMIRVHWDGYISGVGRVLNNHYTDVNKIKELIALGSLSSVHECVAPTPDDVTHSYETPTEGVTVAYTRDRGDKQQLDSVYNDFTEYMSTSHLEEFNYLFKDNKWVVFEHGYGGYVPKQNKFVELETALIAEQESPIGGFY